MNRTHKATLTIRLAIPDGLYVPLGLPIEKMPGTDLTDSFMAGAEVYLYIEEKLSNIGVSIEYSGMNDHYTTTLKEVVEQQKEEVWK